MIYSVDIVSDYEKKLVENFHLKFINNYGGHWENIVMDQSALLAIIKKYQLESFCEIGTWEGYTSLLMWLQPTIKRGVAIDICSDFEGGGDNYHKGLDKFGKYFRGLTPVELRVADSLSYEARLDDRFDMVFLDGNHSYEYVKKDYQLAKKMGTKIISFHDYKNENPGVDKFINELAESTKVLWVTGSAVVFVEVQ